MPVRTVVSELSLGNVATYVPDNVPEWRTTGAIERSGSHQVTTGHPTPDARDNG